MTNYLIAVIVMLLMICAVLFGLIRIQSGKIQKLSMELGETTESLNQCVDINQQNTKEYNKIIAANNAAKKIADEAKLKAEAEVKKQRRRIWEILNAKDNGPIPGVIQRTLDGMRSRAGDYEDREGTAFNPGGNVVVSIPS